MALIVRVITDELYLKLVKDNYIKDDTVLDRNQKIQHVTREHEKAHLIQGILKLLPASIDWDYGGQVIYNDRLVPQTDICELALSLKTPPSRKIKFMREFWKILQDEGLICSQVNLDKVSPKYSKEALYSER